MLQLSYLGNWCVKPEAPVMPCRRDLLGKGPLQDVTTQKHDYTWKCNVPDFDFRPEDNLTFSPLPLECKYIIVIPIHKDKKKIICQ